MAEQQREYNDRRSDEDRRKVHDLDYFSTENDERRRFCERRAKDERRITWAKVGQWASVFMKPLEFGKKDGTYDLLCDKKLKAKVYTDRLKCTR